MLRRYRCGSVTLTILALAACGDPTTPPSLPAGPSTAQSPATSAALEAQVNSLINALYAPTVQGSAFVQFARIKAAVASGRADDAQQAIIAFVRDALAAFTAGQLQDPNGGQPPSTADALRDLLNSVSVFGGLAPPIPPSNPLGGDGAVAVVGPAGGTVVASGGFGGVQFPPGALPADVIVVVERLPNPVEEKKGPLPTTLDQYPLFYDFSTSPFVAQFAQPVTVGICRLEVGEPFGPATQAIADRLVLAHPNPANPATVELLQKVSAPFVSCAGVSLARAIAPGQPRTLLARAADVFRGAGVRALGVFLPTPAYAVHGGLGGLTRSFSPFGAVDPGLKLSAIGAGAHHACLLTTEGAAYCWGSNDQSQLGAATATTCGAVACSTTPIAVSGAVTFQTLDVGDDFACGVSGSTVRCWGSGGSGQLGNGSLSNSTAPVAVAASPLTTVSAGFAHACALTPTGAAVCWGSNQRAELGAATAGPCGFPCSPTPVAVSGGLTFESISAGLVNTCAVSTADAGYCWGGIGAGELGNGTTGGGSAPPTAISGGLTLADLQSSVSPCALTTAGQAYCWGLNSGGQLGDGTTTTRTVPVPVAGGLTFASLASSSGQNNFLSHMCGVTTSGDAYCWGGNTKGELGTATGSACTLGGPQPCSTVPVLVSGGHKWRALAVGLEFSCGITTADAVYCWGANTLGQLGNGTTTNSTLPVLVSGAFSGP